MILKQDLLRNFSEKIFIKAGLLKDDAKIYADALIQANLEGIDSHGVSKLPIYFKRFVEGRVNAKPSIKIDHTAPGTIIADGDNGPGPIVSKRTIDASLDIMKEIGIVGVGVNNSNHFGAASYYCKQACNQQAICIAFTNAPANIAPWGGKEPYFGTNPIAFGFPNGSEPPIIIDMSSSIVAKAKIRIAEEKKEAIPVGWAVDQNGNQTTDPMEALKGTILPIAGPKGYALALSVEIISGLLTGAAFGNHVQGFNDNNAGIANVGHFFILIDINKFMDISVYEQLIQQMITEIKEIPKASGVDEILIPGERRASKAKLRSEKGIPVPVATINKLNELAKQEQVRFM
ncbi:Ldh family oxidoreductase [Salicibibacter cibarius]|uniref:Ldh family oxidoreductase n=2 Tax=Salicibibacter cibarius TaxID=2743000 RepID=A0A7T6Z7X0_9BACI|nr:Ldh family oxidoreductase [Salicibibacter cibarius]